MTIEEAIMHCTETAEKNESMAKRLESASGKPVTQYQKDCAECAKDHRRLAEWLNDLITSSYLLGEAVNEMYKGTSCNPTAWLERYGETASELIRRVDCDKG